MRSGKSAAASERSGSVCDTRRRPNPSRGRANRDQKRQPEAGADAEQRRADMLPQSAVLREFERPGDDLPRCPERWRCRSARRRSTKSRSAAGSRSSAARSSSTWRCLRSQDPRLFHAAQPVARRCHLLPISLRKRQRSVPTPRARSGLDDHIELPARMRAARNVVGRRGRER